MPFDRPGRARSRLRSADGLTAVNSGWRSWMSPRNGHPVRGTRCFRQSGREAGKVEGSKIVALGTRSDDPTGHWFSANGFRGVADYSQLHAARPGDPPFQLRTIRRANPAYAYLPALREALHSQRDEARAHSTARYSYRALALNLGTSDRPESVLLDPADWERCETDLPPARDGAYILAFDMGGASAMTAAAGFWPATGRAEVMAVIGGGPLACGAGPR